MSTEHTREPSEPLAFIASIASVTILLFHNRIALMLTTAYGHQGWWISVALYGLLGLTWLGLIVLKNKPDREPSTIAIFAVFPLILSVFDALSAAGYR